MPEKPALLQRERDVVDSEVCGLGEVRERESEAGGCTGFGPLGR